MSTWPANGSLDWDVPLKTYIDEADALKQDKSTLESDVAAKVGAAGALDTALDARYVNEADRDATVDALVRNTGGVGPLTQAAVDSRVTAGFAPGSKTPDSATLTLLNEWTATGAPYGTPTVRKTAEGLLVLSGSVTAGTVASGTQIASLPVGFRPANRRRFSALDTSTGGFVDLYLEPAGNISLGRAAGAGVIVFLDGTVVVG